MICNDCDELGTVHYVLGAARCQKCADIFNELNRMKRWEKANKVHKCENCSETYRGEYACPHCCDHEPDSSEGYHCLNCGTDCNEDVLSSMYDLAKDRMKYGE